MFNGIGGFALAAHWMNWANVMHCEIDPFCNNVMNHHFPNSYQHEDIRTTDFTIWRGNLDLITGGFPCQPYSTAGKRKGKDDDRHLWPQMLRAIREIQPTWILGENVRGLTNWNGGLVFDEVQSDLEAEGYEVLPFLLPAAGVNAPHRRDRIWFIAHANSSGFGEGNMFGKNRREKEATKGAEQWKERNEKDGERDGGVIRGDDAERDVADPGNIRLERPIHDGSGYEKRAGVIERRETSGRNSKTDWPNFPTQSPICDRNDGVPFGLVDITFSEWINGSLKSLGNAVVPQVVYQIFKAIEQYENNISSL
ncbi:MAG TPA: DNA cytosine methyltransferase [Niastella sp.]